MPSFRPPSLNIAWGALLVCAAWMLAGCGSPESPPGVVVHVDKYNFRSVVIKNKRPVLLEFWSYSCEPCKTLDPKLETLAHEHEEIVVAKVNSEESEAIALEYGVHLVPALFVFEEGQIIRRQIGAPSDKELADLIAPYVRSK